MEHAWAVEHGAAFLRNLSTVEEARVSAARSVMPILWIGQEVLPRDAWFRLKT